MWYSWMIYLFNFLAAKKVNNPQEKSIESLKAFLFKLKRFQYHLKDILKGNLYFTTYWNQAWVCKKKCKSFKGKVFS